MLLIPSIVLMCNQITWWQSNTWCKATLGSYNGQFSDWSRNPVFIDADDAFQTNHLFLFSPAARVHDGILPASQASVYELSGSVGPRPVPRQLTCATDLQHQRVEQVSCILTKTTLLAGLRCFWSWTWAKIWTLIGVCSVRSVWWFQFRFI